MAHLGSDPLTQVTTRLVEHPTGLSVVQLYNRPVAESSDQRFALAMRARWVPVLEAHGVVITGAGSVPPCRTTLTVDKRPFRLEPMRTDGAVYRIPRTVRARVLALQDAGVPFGWWALAEELPLPKPVPVADPILFGILPLGRGKGLWCAIGLWFEEFHEA